MKAHRPPTLRNQAMLYSTMGIVLTLLIALGSTLILTLRREQNTLDQRLLTNAQIIASLDHTRNTLLKKDSPEKLSAFLQSTANDIARLDVIAVMDVNGVVCAAGTAENSLPEDVSAYRMKDGDIVTLTEGKAPAGMERCAYAAVYDADGVHIIGMVAAGVYISEIHYEILYTLGQYSLVAVFALGAGVYLSLRFTRRLKGELLGYEPSDLTDLFRQRVDILETLEEGLLAVDTAGRIIYINKAAIEMLHLQGQPWQRRPLESLYEDTGLLDVIRTGEGVYNISVDVGRQVHILSDRIPLRRGTVIEGAVAIFRNRTEVTRLAEDLTGVRHIVEAMRAHMHEFMNKLHVILGLLQLGEAEKAEEYVLHITQSRSQSIGFIAERISDPSVAALIIGKMSHASELGIQLSLDPATKVHALNPYLNTDLYITILGNLIDNAFDAFRDAPATLAHEVTVSIREETCGLILSVDDTGPGMQPEVLSRIFERGYSTKGKDRGTGLYLVRQAVESCGGSIRVESVPMVGTTFVVTIPNHAHTQEDTPSCTKS